MWCILLIIFNNFSSSRLIKHFEMAEYFAQFNSIFNSTTIESLKEEEKLLASMIFDNAVEIVSSDSFTPVDKFDDQDLVEKLELTKRNLLDIIDKFNKARKELNNFKQCFPNWKLPRQNNISKLRDLADSINSDQFNCNIATVTSSVVGIVGGAAVATSLIFPPAALVLAVGGGITSALGGATVFGTSVTQIALLSSKMKEAKAVLEADQEQFKPMTQWFQRSQEIIDLMDEIIGFSVIREISEGLGKFKENLANLHNLKNGHMHSVLKNLIRMFVERTAPAGIGVLSTELTVIIPIVVTFVFVMILFRKDNKLIFDSIVITHRTVFGLMKLLDLGTDLGMLVCNAVVKTGMASTEAVTKATAKMVAQGVFAGIGIALDVTNLVMASVDIHKGSVSEKAVRLKSVAGQLENELKVLQEVFNALF